MLCSGEEYFVKLNMSEYVNCTYSQLCRLTAVLQSQRPLCLSPKCFFPLYSRPTSTCVTQTKGSKSYSHVHLTSSSVMICDRLVSFLFFFFLSFLFFSIYRGIWGTFSWSVWCSEHWCRHLGNARKAKQWLWCVIYNLTGSHGDESLWMVT